MSSPSLKKDYHHGQVVFAQSRSDANGSYYPYYPATVESTGEELVRCRWFDPDGCFADENNVDSVTKVSRDRIMEFNLENKRHIESTQMDTQDSESQNYWSKCVSEAEGCFDLSLYRKKSKTQTRFQFLQKLQSNQSSQEQNDDDNKVK